MRYWAEKTWEGTTGKKLEQVKELVRKQKRLYGAICRQAKKEGIDIEGFYWNLSLMKPDKSCLALLKFESPQLHSMMIRYLKLEEEIEKSLTFILVIMD